MHVTQHGIDKALEDGGSIGKPERKYKILIVSHGCVQRCLPFIPLTDTLVPKMVVVVKVNPTTDYTFKTGDREKGDGAGPRQDTLQDRLQANTEYIVQST